MCGAACTNVTDDPSYCGNCTNACAQGDTCTAGACGCASSGTVCGIGAGAVCSDTTTDPDNCSGCGDGCDQSQYCTASACTCRPGLTACAGYVYGYACTDTMHDQNNCGTCGNVCPTVGFGRQQRCVDGVCENGCPGGARTFCPANGGCYTQQELNSDPLNCGGCGNVCNADQVCTQGACVGYFTSPACTTCPCTACGTGTTCCDYPGSTQPICVAGGVCP
jgi:hypothetical protein